MQAKWITAGVLFALLWSSASTATKLGLTQAQPLVIAEVRFLIAGLLMLTYSHFIKRNRLPNGKEWQFITVYGLLNITIYLGCYVFAMQHVTAGVGALGVATNPLFISFMSVVFLKKNLSARIIAGIILGTLGVWCASYPLLKQTTVTSAGLLLLLFSMISYSLGAVYFSSKRWHLNLLTINGWQTLIGGLLLLPCALFTYKESSNNFSEKFWLTIGWLAIPVSIFAVQLWLWLLKTNTVKAGLWLFLCPLFGFAIAAWITHDVVSIYTIIGVLLVLAGLFICEKKAEEN